LELSR